MLGRAETTNRSGADMDPAFERARPAVVLALACLIASCHRGSRQSEHSASPGPCPPAPASAYATQAVRAQAVPMELRLPSGSYQSRSFDDSIQRGEAWIGSAGYVVSYAVRAGPVRMRPASMGDHDLITCTERIGGRAAVISMLYSEATTVPGQRVVAVWEDQDGEALVLTAYHPDRNRRDDLLNILRSVQFFADSTPPDIEAKGRATN